MSDERTPWQKLDDEFKARMKAQGDLHKAKVTPEDLLSMATAFEILPYFSGSSLRSLTVQKTSIVGREEAWGIFQDSNFCLNRRSEWEHQPMPSSRDEGFYKRCRWPNAVEAINFARKFLHQYPDGYKPEKEAE